MATTSAVTSSGLGSGLDVDGIVTKLIAADRSSADTRLKGVETKAKVQISALGSMKSAMGSLQTVLASLDATGLGKRTATVSNSAMFTASTTTAARAGQTEIEVVSLAKAHKIGSGSFASSSALVGEGAFTIGVGSGSFTINVGSTMSVAGLRDAINNATDNKGVSANLVTEDGGVRLVLTANSTGTASTLAVTSSATTFSDLQAPADAQVKIDGYTRTSSYNTLVGVVDGVTINLLQAAPGTKTTLSVAADNSAAKTGLQNFVSAYNSLLSTYKSLSAYDATTKSGGVLMGDASTRSVMQTLRSTIAAETGSGTFKLLSQIGISAAVDGTLTIDDNKLSDALATDGSSIRKLFGASDGLTGKVNSLLQGYTSSDGQIETRLDALNDQLDRVSTDRTALDDRMSKLEERYRKQFSSLDAIVSKYNNVASYLDQMDNERYRLKSG